LPHLPQHVLKELISVLGSEKVLTSPVQLLAYARNWNPITRDFASLPDVVVLPESTEEVAEVVKIAYKYNIPITPRGGGTSMAAGSIARGGILIDTKRMDKILELDTDNMVVTVQAGIPLRKLNEELAKYGLWFPYEPESKHLATVGSVIALRSDGTFGIRYGKAEQHICSLTIVDGRGRILKLGHRKTLISASGYHLHWLMVSSEGTLGIITEATLKVIPLPKYRDVAGFAFPSLNTAVKAVIDILSSGLSIEAANINCRRRFQFYTHAYRAKYGREPKIPEWTEAVLFLSFAGDEDVVKFSLEKSESIAKKLGGVLIEEKEIVRSWWSSKHVGRDPPELRFRWEEPFPDFKQKWPDSQKTKRFGAAGVSVPPGKISEMYRKYLEISSKYGLEVLGMNVYFQHPNSPHVSISFAVWVGDSEDEVKRFYMYVAEMAKEAVKLGGSISAYYGDGEVLVGLTEIEHGDSMEYMLKIKEIFDPKGILNPGKKFGESKWIPKEFLR